MTDARVIKCTNTAENISLYLRRTSAARWHPSDFTGLYSSDFDVLTSKNMLSDGAQYLSARVKERNIVLTVTSRSAHRDSRALLYRVFKPRSEGVLEYSDGTIARKINYYAESVSIESKGARSDDSGVMVATISLLCPDPFFYETGNRIARMSTWMPAFTFKHEFSSAGEELGYRSKERLQDIVNASGLDEIGMTVKVEAFGTVKNVSIVNASTNMVCKVGTSDTPLEMVAGDVLEITSEIGQRHVWFTHEGVKKEINYFLSSDSQFLTLKAGHNVIGYNAENGVDNLSVIIIYRMRYAGI